MRENSVFTPLEERRPCTDYNKELTNNKINRVMNSNIKLQKKVKELEKRIIELENLYEQYKESEIQRLKSENGNIKTQIAYMFHKGE